MMDLVRHSPLWLTAVAVVVLLTLAAEAGWFTHGRFGRNARGAASKDDDGFSLTAALSLLALLLGFTFGMALNRYDDRRTLVYTEAEAIGTAWLRAGLIESGEGAALQARLRDYARSRLAMVDAGEDAAAIARARESGAALRAEIWRLTAAGIAPIRTTAQAASLVASVNEVIDVATTREQTLDATVPDTVFYMLAGYAAVAAFLRGFLLSVAGQRHRTVTTLFFTLMAITFTLILDLDRPRAGTIRISQQAMIDAIADMDRLARPPAG